MNDTELLFGDVLTYIEKAEKAIAADDVQALVLMNTAVVHMSERLLRLTPDQVNEYAPEIDHLRARLGVLTQTMEGVRDQVAEDITALGQHHRAARAYLSTPES